MLLIIFTFIFVFFLTDLCGIGEPIIMNMSVRLDKVFQDELEDSSSELYKNYTADLEKAVMTFVFHL